MALIMLAVLRYSAVQGFVSFSEADCLFLLAAPVTRADLVAGRAFGVQPWPWGWAACFWGCLRRSPRVEARDSRRAHARGYSGWLRTGCDFG